MSKIVISLLLSFFLASALAQAPELAGKNELSLHGSLDLQAPNGDNTDIQIGYGWFVADDLLLAGEYRWSLIEDIAPGEDDYRSQQGSFVAEWLFIGASALLPYLGGEIGFRDSSFADQDETGLVYGARLGARYFLAESVAIDASVSWLLSDKDVFIVDFEAEDQYVYPSIGINAVF